MNLGELLDELRNNILHDRSDLVSGSSDYLWSDATLTRYINEAQKRFARKGLVIRDGKTAECCEVVLQTGVTQYDLHSSVLAVVSAKYDTTAADLRRVGHSILDTYQPPDTLYFDANQLATIAPGQPIAFTTDETLGGDDHDSVSVVSMRVFPAPSATENGKKIYLRVMRLPIDALSNTQQTPEIPEDHHLEMLDWAAYLALRIVDHDAGDPARANEFRASFEDHVKTARSNAMRKLFAPMQWGFGRNGFSWER